MSAQHTTGPSPRMNRHTGMWEAPEQYPEEVEVLGLLHEDPGVVTDKVLEVVARVCDERDQARNAMAPLNTLNALRVAIWQRLDYRATGLKDYEIDAAKEWVRAAIAKPTGSPA